MIAYQFGMRIDRRIVNIAGRSILSYEKLYDILALRLIKPHDLAKLGEFDPYSTLGRTGQTIPEIPVHAFLMVMVPMIKSV